MRYTNGEKLTRLDLLSPYRAHESAILHEHISQGNERRILEVVALARQQWFFLIS
jgi:hypothetical protein